MSTVIEITTSAALEKHYSVPEVAAMWHMSDDWVRQVFRDETGVLQSKTRTNRRKRENVKLSIPESVLLRVHAALAVKKAA